MYLFIGIALIAALVSVFMAGSVDAPTPIDIVEEPVAVMCTADAMQCPDGSYVGRTGPKCEFVCPITATSTSQDNSDLIVLTLPQPETILSTPLKISGKARGGWYFEASFPFLLTDWDGKIIAKGIATAVGDWMTSEFVPFTATLNYASPYKVGDPDFMKRGTLILKNDNPSGLPANDKAIEIPVRFAP